MRWILTLAEMVLRAMPRELGEECREEIMDDLRGVLESERARHGSWRMGFAGLVALADLVRGVAREQWIAVHGYEWQRTVARRSRPGMGEWMMMWIRELRMALRALLRRPGFTSVATLTLGLGIGATVAIFTVVNGVVLQPVPFEESDRIVEIEHGAPAIDLPRLNNSPGTINFYRSAAPAFELIAGQQGGAANVRIGDGTERIEAWSISPEFLDVLRVQPAIGRGFVVEDVPNGDPPGVVILTQPGVDRLFGGDRNVVGRTLVLDGRTVEVIGVMPESFRVPDGPDVHVLAPLWIDPNGGFGEFGITGFARLADGQTLESALAQLEGLRSRMAEYDPEITPEILDGFGWHVNLITLKESIVGDTGRLLFVVLGTVALVLLIACANVANLFLVRAEARQKELGIRAALGAGRDRIAGSFLSESLVLGILGGLLGMAIASGSVSALLRWGPQDLPRMNEIAMTPAVLLFAGGVSILTGLLLGVIPMLRYAGRGFTTMLSDGNRTSTDSRSRHRARNILVMGQLALALMLLVGSGLMFRSFLAIRAINLGFDPADKVVVGMSVGQNVPSREAADFYQEVIDRARAIPGVTQAGVTQAVPLSDGNAWGGMIQVEGDDRPENALPRVVVFQAATAGYLEAMEFRLVEGRAMEEYEWQSGLRPIWINTYARDTHLDGDALGRRINWGRTDENGEEQWAEVVGVYEDWKVTDITEDRAGYAFLPMVMEGWGVPDLTSGELVVRTEPDLDPASVVPAIREIVSTVNPSIPLTTTMTMPEIVARSMADRSITLVLLAIATGVAVFLGTIGLFGVISYVVSQRRREIGVRMALGAESGSVSAMVVRQSAGVVGMGIAVGLIGALALSRVLGSFLYSEVSTTDPLTFLAAPVLLLAVSLLATWIPARRASRIDPIEALRAE